MPQGILQYILPEEQTEFDTACKADALFCVIWDMREWLFRQQKFCETTPPILAKLWQIIEDRGCGELFE